MCRRSPRTHPRCCMIMHDVVEIDIFNSSFSFLKPQPKQKPNEHKTHQKPKPKSENAPLATSSSTSDMCHVVPTAGSDERHGQRRATREMGTSIGGTRAQRAQRRSTLILQSPGLFFCMVPAGDGRIMTRTGWDLSRGGRFVLGWTFDALS